MKRDARRIALAALSLDSASFHHITFKDIPPTKYEFAGDHATMAVTKSASAMVQSFPTVRTVTAMQFEWRGTGTVGVLDARHEQTKRGDDARLRIGLMLEGKKPTVPFFAPAWIKAVDAVMKLPAERLQYYVVDAKAAPGSEWDSPYASSIVNLALASTPDKDGWNKVRYKLPGSVTIVGIWLMADGDDTGSTFTTELRALDLEGQ